MKFPSTVMKYIVHEKLSSSSVSSSITSAESSWTDWLVQSLSLRDPCTLNHYCSYKHSSGVLRLLYLQASSCSTVKGAGCPSIQLIRSSVDSASWSMEVCVVDPLTSGLEMSGLPSRLRLHIATGLIQYCIRYHSQLIFNDKQEFKYYIKTIVFN